MIRDRVMRFTYPDFKNLLSKVELECEECNDECEKCERTVDVHLKRI